MVSYSEYPKESRNYEYSKIGLWKIKYKEHKWLIYEDIKIICMLLGPQEYTKFSCYICERDSQVHGIELKNNKSRCKIKERWEIMLF